MLQNYSHINSELFWGIGGWGNSSYPGVYGGVGYWGIVIAEKVGEHQDTGMRSILDIGAEAIQAHSGSSKG